ncbi:hypothetical protein ACFVWR_10800 [Leifsonia sp. NPDC058292]|uniref:hypothetical protein n=1 Tax=Leifsonia sp. NPDC058292 TaxID=3346428 RepID=UPI0036DE35D6
MFDLFNRPFLDEAVARGQTIHFTHDPESWGGAPWKELEYLESEGYMYDPETMTAILWRDK